MTMITQEQGDAQYQKAMFHDALNEIYLGNPAVVGGLVADYCLAVREMLVQRAAGTLTAAEFVARINEMCAEQSAIFSGRDPAYKGIIGWHPLSLNAHLVVSLKSYWTDNRAAHGDDPIKVLFAWLCWAVFDAMERSHDDPDLEGIILSDRTHAVIRMLLGTDGRA